MKFGRENDVLCDSSRIVVRGGNFRLLLSLCVLTLAVPIHAERDEAGFVWLDPDELVWQELEPGITFAIIEGNPQSKGTPSAKSFTSYVPGSRQALSVRHIFTRTTGL